GIANRDDESAKPTNLMPTMPAEAANRPKPKMPHAQNFMDLPKPVVPKTENRKLLKGQKAIVTGASSGIGRSIALALGHAGADVCINYVAGEDKAQAMVDELRGHGHTAFAYRADVSNEDVVAKMFGAVRDKFGTVDILINNAGLQQDAPCRIRVNSVAPGPIRTPINMQAWDTPEHYNELLKLIPYKRIGEPEEIGRVAVWLASDESDYIQGATLFVDGGMTLYPGFET